MLLCREGINSGCEQTACLMRLAGVTGKGKGCCPVTTRRPKGGRIIARIWSAVSFEPLGRIGCG